MSPAYPTRKCWSQDTHQPQAFPLSSHASYHIGIFLKFNISESCERTKPAFHRAFPRRDFLSPTQLKCTIILLWSVVSDSGTPWTVAHRAPLSIGFSRQDYWSGLPYPSPGDLPDPASEPACLASPILAGRFFPAAPDIPRVEKSSYGVAMFPLSVLSCLFSVLSTPKCSGLMQSNRSVSFVSFSPATPSAKISPAILRDFKNSFQKWGR